MHSVATSYGGLNCRVLQEGDDAPEVLFVLCHGYGAPGTDLVPLGPEIASAAPHLRDRIRFAFPEAPLSLAEMGLPDGRAWWHLDVAAISRAIEQGELRDLRGGFPEGVPEARDMLSAAVTELAAEAGLPLDRVVLGGFSQGSMLATDVALRLPESPAGLCVLSGTLVAEEEWRALASDRGAMPVFQSHGRFDPILPFQGATWLRDALVESGLPVEFHEFDGVHTIPYEAIQRMAALVEGAVGATR